MVCQYILIYFPFFCNGKNKAREENAEGGRWVMLEKVLPQWWYLNKDLKRVEGEIKMLDYPNQKEH